MLDKKTVTINFRLSQDVKEFLDKIAKEEERSISSLVRLAIQKYIKELQEEGR